MIEVRWERGPLWRILRPIQIGRPQILSRLQVPGFGRTVEKVRLVYGVFLKRLFKQRDVRPVPRREIVGIVRAVSQVLGAGAAGDAIVLLLRQPVDC